MTTPPSIAQILIKHSRHPLTPEKLTSDTALSSIDIESLDLAMVTFDIEDHYGIEIPYTQDDDRTAKFLELRNPTIGDLEKLVASFVANPYVAQQKPFDAPRPSAISPLQPTLANEEKPDPLGR